MKRDPATASGSVRRSRLESGPRPYLEETTTVRVWFNEVDALRVVWHGHYASYFEEARRAFGRRYGVDYPLFLKHNVAVPVIQLRVEYFAPARFSDVLEVTARLLKSESARLDFDYEVRRQGEPALLATGSTSQVLTTLAGELLPTWPPFLVERRTNWGPLWRAPLPHHQRQKPRTILQGSFHP